jgi:hypothetical protein
MWKKTNKWRPRSGTGSNPIAVEKDGQLGLAKQRGMEKEQLTTALAAKVLAPIPLVEFDTIEGQNGDWAVSAARASPGRALSTSVG